MSTTILERCRQAHEDIELFERSIVTTCVDDARNHRENVYQSHWVNLFTEKIVDRYSQLYKLYLDEDGARKDEIAAMAGKGAQLFSNFYDQLRNVKEYHRRFPYLQPERPEAEQLINNTNVEDLVTFSGEECFGKYLDLHSHFERYKNLKGVKPDLQVLKYGTNDLHYFKYLDIFYKFTDSKVVKDKEYLVYLEELFNYLVEFFKRRQPLYQLDLTLKQFEDDFESEWQSGMFKPFCYTEADSEKEANPLYCKYSKKLFKNEGSFQAYRSGKNFKKVKNFYETTYKQICCLEVKINRLSGLLLEQIDATKSNIEKKQARHYIENEADMEEDSDVSSSDDDEEEVRMTKENYPVGWDGNPIPFWLYKLHGLGIEYKCEICGNMSYWGRRAFERHFQEWRHAHGMKCLQLDNTKEFNEITRIQDALELSKKLRELRTKDKWDDETMQEFEDNEGNVMNKKTYMDLKAQGLN
uniref:Matrin-type domain-containing protein n=1 Tax=Arcella intermedia TaxID=1963864 RepID=A0A6B2L385_9EUKA|eukprot:TRINITY_DN26209_c0_g1_i1.p1 TRINITY_DN26209_c0_g1~~TRINITY_DN26209_c0_g1_i1.p1  ORF type:complete len:469 (-),score=108.09 TRINITY_DN26209_c0_g1_i1:19-1425(-)